jgi:acyl carrier protein
MSNGEPSEAVRDVEDELRELIVDGLVLEDTDPEEIEPEEPLFVEGLGLDSVDALELAMIIQKEYGIKIRGTTEENKEHFQSLRALARFVVDHRDGNES